jgi:hypothetical protein
MFGGNDHQQGKNAGKFECVGEDLAFKVFTTSSKTGEIVGEKRAFDISLSSVKNAQVSALLSTSIVSRNFVIDSIIQVNPNKDEILLEFSQSDHTGGRKNECFLVG